MNIDFSTEFGHNAWLVEQMYEEYLKDKSSVDKSWQEIFIKYENQNNQNTIVEEIKTTTNKNDKKIVENKLTEPTSKNNPIVKDETEYQPLRGVYKTIVNNMVNSLEIPTATSVRTIPAKLLIENRITVNGFLKNTRGGKLSFTHLVGYAIVQALKIFPNMNYHFAEIDSKPNIAIPAHTNLGLAIDLPGKNGNRSLVVAAIKKCESMNFAEFLIAYEDIVTRARKNKLTANDFADVTISLTNPGTLGTVSSVPRLMKNQGTIVGVGSLEFPAEFQGTSESKLADIGIGKILTLTSTYDHRIIQGADSGEFLKTISDLLLSDEFYDDIFASLDIPYMPVRWRPDNQDPSINKNSQVYELINAYRRLGHLIANVDPLENSTEISRKISELDILNYGLTLWDLDRTFKVSALLTGKNEMTLREILDILRNAYCGRIGIEFTHILDETRRNWVKDEVENGFKKLSSEEQKYILTRLNAAEAFETFLHTKYIGQKRFSLEGAESLISILDSILESASGNNLDEVIIAMPHRGRLNVLANIVGKPYAEIFNEFEGNQDPSKMYGSGDVKYHLGMSGIYSSSFHKNSIPVSVTANPSHLEAVDSVLEGITRAKQTFNKTKNKKFSFLPISIHGDAAFAGQGVVAETLNLSQLSGYETGGTIHVIVNNQIGFTTSPIDARSSIYSTDVAKMIGAPVFHVNGDDPEACYQVAMLATKYRETFHADVIIDLVCYRKRGHNEGDDPTMTQPVLYKKINSHPSIREIYTKNLVGRGDITPEEATAAFDDYQTQLEKVFNESKESEKFAPKPSPSVMEEQKLPIKLNTNISLAMVQKIGDSFISLPDGFTANERVFNVLERRKEMSLNGNIDWSFAELLAFGSLVSDQRYVRLSGQDSRRGTFSQRHSIIVDAINGNKFSPLSIVENGSGKFEVVDSPLSEYAVLGFEYGFSTINNKGLTLWEAQFGDFANGAQTIIDEYISSGEAKWEQLADLVMLLPHGQEGQGPDHSSARIERFLQLCAESSMTLAIPTTPANYFHLLRRHALDDIHRPLIVFTPKSMLRNKNAVSQINDFTNSKFQSVIDDPNINTKNKQKVKKIIFTSGKVFYDLQDRKLKENRDDIALIRLEQLYPLPYRRIEETIKSYPKSVEIVWLQEEPANQGAWPYLILELEDKIPGLFSKIKRISRRSMSSTSTGSSKIHVVEQKELLDEAFN